MNKTTKNRTGDQYAYYAGTYCRDWLGVFWGYPKYEMMQLEDQTRQQLQSGRFADLEAKYQPILQREKVELTILDQYPNIRFYTCWLENKKLSVKSEQDVKNIACDSVEAFQNFDYKSRTAVLNVIEEDQIVFHMNVKNKFGTDMMQHQQKLLDCPSFLHMRALKAGEEYIPPPQKNTPVDMVALAASVSEEAVQPLS
ncbi:hypothetical protein [Acinetobacter schindleri]|uniref:hypothetical protein n=1 Tax=Acinetobacter schindleri TaxID=108981 RepID=UPI000972C711|nr:hypothetical protein [Acinetobacter schindleri]APX62086.1 hypothetical protein AsACE_CH00649 [Acinetobacter schindleri]